MNSSPSNSTGGGRLRSRPDQGRRAFTLIEIMLAMAIFTMLVGAVYATWMAILRSAEVEQTAAAQVQRQRIAIRTLEDSLTCIQSFQASMSYYTFNVTNSTDQPVLSFVAHVPNVFPRNGRFDSDLRRLTFSVEPAASSSLGTGNSEKDLVLRQNEILKDMDADEQAVPLVLARNVKDFVIECWDTNALDWAKEWTDTNSLPPMVRITLTLNRSNPRGQSGNDSSVPGLMVTREIALPSMTLPRMAQTGTPNPVGAGGNLRPGGAGGQNGNNGNQNNSGQIPIQRNPNRPSNPNAGTTSPGLYPPPGAGTPLVPGGRNRQ